MLREIIGVGGFFFLMLLGMLYIFQHAEVNQLTDLLHLQLGAKGHVSTYELTLLFTTFVMTHFFYLFNALAFCSIVRDVTLRLQNLSDFHFNFGVWSDIN